MIFYVIYNHPKDYPEGFVCVLWRNTTRVKVAGYSETLEGARKFVPDGLFNIGRRNGDDPCIEETWL